MSVQTHLRHRSSKFTVIAIASATVSILTIERMNEKMKRSLSSYLYKNKTVFWT